MQSFESTDSLKVIARYKTSLDLVCAHRQGVNRARYGSTVLVRGDVCLRSYELFDLGGHVLGRVDKMAVVF
jgi:hypothetical protein